MSKLQGWLILSCLNGGMNLYCVSHGMNDRADVYAFATIGFLVVAVLSHILDKTESK